MNNSILNDIKKLLGIEESYDIFDPDLIMHINSVFLILNQLGVGPEDCYSITGPTETWNNFFQDTKKLEMVKTYVFMKVKLIFDPPLSSSVTEVIKNTIAELEWRLNIAVDPKI